MQKSAVVCSVELLCAVLLHVMVFLHAMQLSAVLSKFAQHFAVLTGYVQCCCMLGSALQLLCSQVQGCGKLNSIVQY